MQLTVLYWDELQQKVRKDDEEGEESEMKGREEQEEGWSPLGHVWEAVQQQNQKAKILKKAENWQKAEDRKQDI